jgi:hypothetical protein
MSKRPTSNVPLQCILCPKLPTFSDISHLLTHISSKSHLSHRFKLQIRSQAEPEARQVLDNFETWYAENSLEDLLSDRLAAKEHKKATKKTRGSVAPVGVLTYKHLFNTDTLGTGEVGAANEQIRTKKYPFRSDLSSTFPAYA